MGGGIAMNFLSAGIPVTIVEQKQEALGAFLEGFGVWAPLIFVVFAVFGRLPGPEALLAIPGLALLAANAFALALLLGMACARFRDIPPIVASVLQLAFFMSPVLWKPELLGEKQAWLPLNPFYVLMEVVRGPLVEGGAPGLVWLSAVVFTLLACAGQ